MACASASSSSSSGEASRRVLFGRLDVDAAPSAKKSSAFAITAKDEVDEDDEDEEHNVVEPKF